MAVERKRTPLADRPTASATALLVIDVFSDWQFPDAEALAAAADGFAPALGRLQARCRDAGVAVVYVNDNAGAWISDAPGLVSRAAAATPAGARIVAHAGPRPGDLFVLKPKHSAFYATPLDLLLRHLAAKRLLLAGVAAEHCVALTAREAHMRDYDVTVLRDLVGGVTPVGCRDALDALVHESVADVRESRALRLPGR